MMPSAILMMSFILGCLLVWGYRVAHAGFPRGCETSERLPASLRSEHDASDKGRTPGLDLIGHDRVYPSAGRDRHAGRVNVGIKLRLQGTDGGDLGIAHAPPPVELGDVLSLADGSIWRVVNLIDLYDLDNTTGVIDMLCMVEPA